MPGYLPPPAGFDRFQKCFFGRKPARVALGRGGTFGIAVFSFLWCKYAFAETGGSRHRFRDAVNFNYVDASGDDHERC